MKHCLLLTPLLLLAACSPDGGPSLKIRHDSVTLSHIPADGSTLCLQVVGDNIIRVTALPEGKPSAKTGLMCDWMTRRRSRQIRLLRRPDTLWVEAPAIKARVLTKTGELAFYDGNGQLLLAEKAGGGRSFTPIEVDGYQGYSFRQVFESPDDEAFYGLGQHQSGEMNYKGRNESLYQYNTKVSVPFVVSSRHYGLLWDNCSLTRWGDWRDYASLEQFQLYDIEGQAGALTASYTDKRNGQMLLQRRESHINYEDLETVKDLPYQVNLSRAKVCWDGYLEPAESGLWHFRLHYAGYVRLWMDGEEIVTERWRTAWNPNQYKFVLPMEKGRRHRLHIEWLPDGGTSYLSLKALSPLPESDRQRMSWWSEMGRQMDYYVIAGATADEVVAGYRYLTGKAQVMPRWAMGYWQSRERYKTQQELVGTLAEFRRREFPIDNIVQDWSYWQEDQWGSHEFDSLRFPDPRKMVEDIHAMNGRLMISVWPKFYVNTDNYRALERIGGIYPRAVQDSIRDWIGRGYIGSFYDPFNGAARRLYWKQMAQRLLPLGIDAWWMDASEPDILSNAGMDYRKALMSPLAIGSSTEYFNAYGLMNARGIYEGQRSAEPDRRVFLLTRSGYAGSQRYGAAIWSGDIATRWEDMAAQITAGLNYSISGNPYWTMDDGGFCVEHRYERAREGSEDLEEWRELNVRWHQFGAFAPLFRSHGQYPYREPWHIAHEGHPAYQALLDYNRLRYRLMPYIYSLAGRCHWDDYTIMRPLVMDFPDDRTVRDIADEYMFGPAFLVAPVCEYKARSRWVYFPTGCDWYDFYSGQRYAGGQRVEVAAPYDRMPLFVRAGSIIPMGEDIQHTAQSQRHLTLAVYPGRDSRFSLYDDDGTSYDYEQGKCSWLDVSYTDSTGRVELAPRRGSVEDLRKKYSITVKVVGRDSVLTVGRVGIPSMLSGIPCLPAGSLQHRASVGRASRLFLHSLPGKIHFPWHTAQKNSWKFLSSCAVLRKKGDSNPRYGYPYDSLANCWFQPLTHPSGSKAEMPAWPFFNCGAKIMKRASCTKQKADFYLKNNYISERQNIYLCQRKERAGESRG